MTGRCSASTASAPPAGTLTTHDRPVPLPSQAPPVDDGPLHGGPAWGFARPKPYHAHVFLPGWSGRKRIAHLTDLHFGSVTPLSLQRDAVSLVNAARPHIGRMHARA